LLALEQQRDEWRGEQQGCPDLEAFDLDQMTHALASSPVADLVVILQAHDEPVTGESGGRSAVAATPEYRVAPVVNERRLECLGQVREAPEVRVVAVPFAGEHGMERVMEIVGPLGVEPITARLTRPKEPRVIQIALRHQGQLSPELGFYPVHFV